MKFYSIILSVSICIFTLFPNQSWAQSTIPDGGKEISSQLIGVFFEDISFSADGGLNAELIQNGSFEYSPSERDGWGPGTSWKMIRHGHSTGYIEPFTDNPIHTNNPHYMRIYAEHIGHHSDYNGWTGIGIQNEGFDGIVIRPGETYNFSMFARCVDREKIIMRISILGESNMILGDTILTVSQNNWKNYRTTFTPSVGNNHARLSLVMLSEGSVDIDMVSLIPQDTYKQHGLRRDLCEALEAIHPKFVRFPGGCVVHGGGDGFWDTYRWKNTVGPKELRKSLKNPWGYHQSMGLGYYEYFQLCEDLGAEPLPILPTGVSCQGAGGSWGLREQNQMVVPMNEMDEWTQDVLDLIEWANGDVTTKWGAIRAEAGHPEPFNLKYIGLGNEEKITPEFEERFKYIYNTVKEAYPNIIIVGTAGPGSHKGNPDYDNAWRFAEEIDLPIIDEHYYERREYFLNNQHNYDSYPRGRKTKVYLGEYAMKDRDWTWMDALSEGLYLLSIERNGDVVCMTSYAPLFAKRGHTNWDPDLIYFDNTSVYLTCSYYVQQMFGISSGNYFYDNIVTFKNSSNLLGSSVIFNSKTRQLYLKIINASNDNSKAIINLDKFGKLPQTAEMTFLTGMENSRNNYERHDIFPQKQIINTADIKELNVAPYTFILITIQL